MKTIKEFVCNPLPTKNAHASTILPLPDGSVITAWFGGVKEGTKDVDIWYCKRDENGWGTPKSLSYNKNIPHWNPVLFLRENGDIQSMVCHQLFQQRVCAGRVLAVYRQQ